MHTLHSQRINNVCTYNNVLVPRLACVVLKMLLCISNLAGLLPASFALLRQMRFCRRQYMPLNSAEDANVSETHKIASFKPASLSPNRETFVGRGEDEA